MWECSGNLRFCMVSVSDRDQVHIKSKLTPVYVMHAPFV